MPFGDHIVTRQALVSREEFSGQRIPQQPVEVPSADPPPWWGEYLLEEWKRRTGFEQTPRDGRTQWQRANDDWQRTMVNWQFQDRGFIGYRPPLTRPRHDVWGASLIEPES